MKKKLIIPDHKPQQRYFRQSFEQINYLCEKWKLNWEDEKEYEDKEYYDCYVIYKLPTELDKKPKSLKIYLTDLIKQGKPIPIGKGFLFSKLYRESVFKIIHPLPVTSYSKGDVLFLDNKGESIPIFIGKNVPRECKYFSREKFLSFYGNYVEELKLTQKELKKYSINMFYE